MKDKEDKAQLLKQSEWKHALHKKVPRLNILNCDMLIFNGLRNENVQLASDMSLAEETTEEQNTEFIKRLVQQPRIRNS